MVKISDLIEDAMTMIARRRKWMVTAVIILLACSLTQIALSWARRPIPSREELCQTLAGNLEWSECLAQPSVSGIVHEAFQPGITTREEVHRAIGQYLDSDSGSETYHLSGTWLTRNLDFPETDYIFLYDNGDRLLNIMVQD